VLKPAPENILDLYLGSLEALGLDLKQNDVRFVEDDWESPTLGAWGLGWEVWLNGMEVTQFTYFQQVGGIDCKPITGEITYGLERLAMYLQGVDNVYKLTWTEGLSYGDVYHQNEVEQSAYNFEESDPTVLFRHFADHEGTAKRLMDAELALPAYEQVLKAAHTFNLLDARGAISVTERNEYIGRIRNLAKAVAKSYYESRERLGFPMRSGGAGRCSTRARTCMPSAASSACARRMRSALCAFSCASSIHLTPMPRCGTRNCTGRPSELARASMSASRSGSSTLMSTSGGGASRP